MVILCHRLYCYSYVTLYVSITHTRTTHLGSLLFINFITASVHPIASGCARTYADNNVKVSYFCLENNGLLIKKDSKRHKLIEIVMKNLLKETVILLFPVMIIIIMYPLFLMYIGLIE